MIKRTTRAAFGLGLMSSLAGQFAGAATLAEDVQSLYDSKLKDLFIHFHENPELSFKEDKTAARLGDELEALGYTVHRGIGGTGLIAMLENGPGPTVMFVPTWTVSLCKKSLDCPMRPKRSSSIGTATKFM